MGYLLGRRCTMAGPLVSDALWERVKPLLPPPKPRRFRCPGRKPLDERRVLTGVIFVLKTGIPWEELPQEMGCGCGMSCWNYLRGGKRLASGNACTKSSWPSFGGP